MNPTPSEFDLANKKIAAACQTCQSSCCKKGLLFMLPHEVDRINKWIVENDSALSKQFNSQLRHHDGFSLFDQQHACIFLDQANLCRLHASGTKPKECFIWPLHVYQDHFGRADIRLSTSCCEGYKFITQDHPSVAEAIAYAREIGHVRLTAFRSAYAGSYGTTHLKHLDLQTNVASLPAAELQRYRAVGESFFPNEDWDRGMRRLEGMLNKFPDGILAYQQDGHITGYLTLWPLTDDAARRLESGELVDCDVDCDALPPEGSAFTGKWITTAIGVVPEGREQRRLIILSLLAAMVARLPAGMSHHIYAHAATESGERFLKRTGFRFCSPLAANLCCLQI